MIKRMHVADDRMDSDPVGGSIRLTKEEGFRQAIKAITQAYRENKRVAFHFITVRLGESEIEYAGDMHVVSYPKGLAATLYELSGNTRNNPSESLQ
ncbi:hypothetical protein [Paenibacillus cymbidii]|uniref:hypothetical protein n=1 Tax=Paenibacillus cymbidii TaxID=1639034 RepID=UPI001081DF96|nr:hypothetical protein [Paenibacillus cymbidii]